jgi:hypothetical protein
MSAEPAAEPVDQGDETLEEWARRTVAAMPPPDQATLDRLAVLLDPGGDHA